MKRHDLGRTGIRVPALAMGAASLGSIYHPVSQDEADATVAAALECELNYFDVAPYYGLTTAETALGKALKGFDRKSYTLATKIGRYGDQDWDFSADATKRSIEASLGRLGTDHIDVIQCHDIEYGNMDQLRNEALPTLRKLKEEGVVRFVGITGYRLDIIEKVALEEKIDTGDGLLHLHLAGSPSGAGGRAPRRRRNRRAQRQSAWHGAADDARRTVLAPGATSAFSNWSRRRRAFVRSQAPTSPSWRCASR